MMSNKTKPNQSISASITGDVSGQVAVGQNINQSRSEFHPAVTVDEIQELQQMLAQLKSKVEAEAPVEKKEAALERVDELEQAITEKKPDLSTMEYVKNWFGKHAPGLAGAVVSVVVHPIVGKLVEAAGDMLTADFRKRFGGPG
jgi:hypothetical protein